MSDGLSIKNLSNDHKKRVRSLRKNNDLEIEKLKLAHQKRVNELKNQNEVNLITLKGQNENRRIQEIQRNEQILNKLKKNVTDTKTVTDQEIKSLKENYNIKKENIEKTFKTDIQKTKENGQLVMQDINEEANLELQKLRRKINEEKQKLVNNNLKEKRNLKYSHDNNVQLNKNLYTRKQISQQEKYQRALLKQKKDHVHELTIEEKKHQKQIQNKQTQFFKEMDKLKRDASLKKDLKLFKFEKDYKKINKDNEKLLQSLLKRKEDIIQGLRQELLKEYKIGMESSEDPFFDFKKLNPSIKENDNAYEVSIPIRKEEADQIYLKGEDRTLTLTFERRNEFTKNEESGEVNSLNKYETYISKHPVQEIVNPNNIFKFYKDGAVVFKIAKK